MNVYQKILVRLYEITGGTDSVTVDFRELLKKEGFYPSYDDIFKQLSHQGWITEGGRDGIVKITHWGVKEAKKSQTATPDGQRELKKSATKLKEEVKELLVMSEELAADTSAEQFEQVRGKLDNVNSIFEKIKENF